MKWFVMLLALVLVASVGCGSDDERVSELEDRIAVLEAEVSDLVVRNALEDITVEEAAVVLSRTRCGFQNENYCLDYIVAGVEKSVSWTNGDSPPACWTEARVGSRLPVRCL